MRAAAGQLDHRTTLADEHTLEVDIAKDQNLNQLFERLSRTGIEVVSMRNKVNRLEEIFMRLVEARAACRTIRSRLPLPRRVQLPDGRCRHNEVAAAPHAILRRRPLDRLQDDRHPRVRADPLCGSGARRLCRRP